jgi:putative ABC transport system permease protein
MNWIAWKMLTGDRGKYYGTVFGVAFGVLLIAQQTSIFIGLMRRTAHVVLDIQDAEIWVMDPYMQNADEIKPMSESDLSRVRGVAGVEWAVRFFKSLARAKIETGHFRQVFLLGLDDHTLVGAPVKMVEGSLASLRQPDAIIVDKFGYQYLWGNEPIRLGRTLEMNDRRAVVVGICEATPPFQTFPIVYTRYSNAVRYVASERKVMSFILARPQEGLTPLDVGRRIREKTGLMAYTRSEFMTMIIKYYMKHTGIPVNFGITITLGLIVGTAITGQTFYLFTIENLKQFGALKAMGVSNLRITLMVLLQASVVGLIGYGLGIGMTAFFFEITKDVTALSGFYLQWQVALMALAAVTVIIVLASFISLRRVLLLEPAVVFRG